jgi:hypothetical protein
MADGKDHERIWLEPGEPKSSEGRMWCEDNAWTHRGEHGQATEYVRADLVKGRTITFRKLLKIVTLWLIFPIITYAVATAEPEDPMEPAKRG